MAVFIALLPALLCAGVALFIHGGSALRALLRNEVLLDLIGDVFVQLMLGGPVIAFLLGVAGLNGGLDANPGMAAIWMATTIAIAYAFKAAAKNARALSGQ